MKKKSKKHGGKKKWIQAANAEMERKGTKGSYGHHSEKTMEKDIAKGGKKGKKAQFAMNMRRLAMKKKHRKSSAKRSRKG